MFPPVLVFEPPLPGFQALAKGVNHKAGINVRLFQIKRIRKSLSTIASA